MERILAAKHLEDEVRHDVRQGELDVATHDVRVANSPPLPDPDAVEGPEDRVRKTVLFRGAAGEVLGGELLEAVCGDRWWARELGALRRREHRRRLVHHRRAHDDDPLEPPSLVRRDRRIERRREDPLVLCEEVIGELVEVADPADHRRRGDDLVAVGSELTEQCHVLGVAADEAVARVAVVALGERAVLAEVVDADHVMTGLEELRDKVPADEPGGSGDKDLQSRIPPPIAPQMSTTSRPPIASPR
jgi:hypothetical protein